MVLSPSAPGLAVAHVRRSRRRCQLHLCTSGQARLSSTQGVFNACLLTPSTSMNSQDLEISLTFHDSCWISGSQWYPVPAMSLFRPPLPTIHAPHIATVAAGPTSPNAVAIIVPQTMRGKRNATLQHQVALKAATRHTRVMDTPKWWLQFLVLALTREVLAQHSRHASIIASSKSRRGKVLKRREKNSRNSSRNSMSKRLRCQHSLSTCKPKATSSLLALHSHRMWRALRRFVWHGHNGANSRGYSRTGSSPSSLRSLHD